MSDNPASNISLPSAAAKPADVFRVGANKAAAYLPGVALAGAIAVLATFATTRLGGPVMLYALLIGIAFSAIGKDERFMPGITFAAKQILRIGVALLGVRITVGDVASLGAPTVLLVVCGVTFAISAGTLIGRAFGLRSDHALLSAGAVAICGASAALAISAVLPQHKDSERNTILTVIGVTTLSTVAMVLYPFITEALGLTDRQSGIFIGATIHDVAQVVGAGYTVSDEAGDTATIVKLMRVACLVPVVFLTCLYFRKDCIETADDAKTPPLLPLFLIGFVVLMIINSLGLIPQGVGAGISDASRYGLVTAVAALGVKTSLGAMTKVGPAPVAVMTLQTVLLALFGLTGLFVIHLFFV